MQLTVLPEAEVPTVARWLANRTRAAGEPRQEAIMEMFTTILLYQFSQLSREEVLEMLGLTTEELKRTRFYQQVFAEGQSLIVGRQLRRRFGH